VKYDAILWSKLLIGSSKIIGAFIFDIFDSEINKANATAFCSHSLKILFIE